MLLIDDIQSYHWIYQR